MTINSDVALEFVGIIAKEDLSGMTDTAEQLLDELVNNKCNIYIISAHVLSNGRYSNNAEFIISWLTDHTDFKRYAPYLYFPDQLPLVDQFIAPYATPLIKLDS